MSILSKESELAIIQTLTERFDKAIATYMDMRRPPTGLVSRRELKEDLEITTLTLEQWEKAGLKRYSPPVEGTRKIYYRVTDILAFLGVE